MPPFKLSTGSLSYFSPSLKRTLRNCIDKLEIRVLELCDTSGIKTDGWNTPWELRLGFVDRPRGERDRLVGRSDRRTGAFFHFHFTAWSLDGHRLYGSKSCPVSIWQRRAFEPNDGTQGSARVLTNPHHPEHKVEKSSHFRRPYVKPSPNNLVNRVPTYLQ